MCITWPHICFTIHLLWCMIYIIIGSVQLVSGVFFFFSLPILKLGSNIWIGIWNILFGVGGAVTALIGKWTLSKQRMFLYLAVSVLIANVINLVILEVGEWHILLPVAAKKLIEQGNLKMLVLYARTITSISTIVAAVIAFVDSQITFCSMQYHERVYHKKSSEKQDVLSDTEYVLPRVKSDSDDNENAEYFAKQYPQSWVFETQTAETSTINSVPNRYSQTSEEPVVGLKQTSSEAEFKDISTQNLNIEQPVVVVENTSDYTDRQLHYMATFSRTPSPVAASETSSEDSCSIHGPPIQECLEKLTEPAVYRSRLDTALSTNSTVIERPPPSMSPRPPSISAVDQLQHDSLMVELQETISNKSEKITEEKINEFCPRVEKVNEFSQRVEKTPEFSTRPHKLDDFSPRTEKITNFSPQADNIVGFSSRAATLSNFSPPVEKITDFGECVMKVTEISQRSENLIETTYERKDFMEVAKETLSAVTTPDGDDATNGDGESNNSNNVSTDKETIIEFKSDDEVEMPCHETEDEPPQCVGICDTLDLIEGIRDTDKQEESMKRSDIDDIFKIAESEVTNDFVESVVRETSRIMEPVVEESRETSTASEAKEEDSVSESASESKDEAIIESLPQPSTFLKRDDTVSETERQPSPAQTPEPMEELVFEQAAPESESSEINYNNVNKDESDTDREEDKDSVRNIEPISLGSMDIPPPEIDHIAEGTDQETDSSDFAIPPPAEEDEGLNNGVDPDEWDESEDDSVDSSCVQRIPPTTTPND